MQRTWLNTPAPWMFYGALVLTSCGFGAACSSNDDDDDVTPTPTDTPDSTVTPSPSPTPTATPPVNPTLLRPSKSGTIDISADDSFVVMVNPDDDSISVFSTADNARYGRIITGDEPSAVVIDPDNRTAYIANRADATVVRVSGLDTGVLEISDPVQVGSEPTGLALSPSGAWLFVAEWGEGRVSMIETATMTLSSYFDTPRNPRALAVTNDGDKLDEDEYLIIPEFYGAPIPGAEGTDASRRGEVLSYHVGTLAPRTSVFFQPISSGVTPSGGSSAVMTSPNQLFSVAVNEEKLYVTSISASPAAPAVFNGNVYPVIYVADIETSAEDTGDAGSTSLAPLIASALGEGTTRYFLADMIDLSFVPGTNTAYAISRGTDIVQRIDFDPEDGVRIGSQNRVQIDLSTPADGSPACQAPTGIVAMRDGSRVFVNCWLSRSMAVVDLETDSVVTVVKSATLPSSGDKPTESLIQDGKRFFYSARGRWSRDGWSDCGTCHPDGLSDGMTWIFGTGPRQSTSLDGAWSHGSGAQKQRVFNWTAVFDEIHDFERNTRDVSGGLGALTTSETGACGDIAQEQQVSLSGINGLDKPLRELQEQTPTCNEDWDAIEAYIRAIRPPRGRRALDAASVARGAVLFGEPTESANNGGCIRCHAGAGWTVSRLFWTPSELANADLQTMSFTPPVPPWDDTWNNHMYQIESQQPVSESETGPLEASVISPRQVACVIRNVGTFGVPGDDEATDALEVKPDGSRAQGRGGYNVPPLYGLGVSPPFLHHGQAATLEDLITDAKWEGHLLAGNPKFLATGNPAQQRQDLVNYLLSIDATTPELELPAGYDGCFEVYPTPTPEPEGE